VGHSRMCPKGYRDCDHPLGARATATTLWARAQRSPSFFIRDVQSLWRRSATSRDGFCVNVTIEKMFLQTVLRLPKATTLTRSCFYFCYSIRLRNS
jgi:hypothetical protein